MGISSHRIVFVILVLFTSALSYSQQADDLNPYAASVMSTSNTRSESLLEELERYHARHINAEHSEVQIYQGAEQILSHYVKDYRTLEHEDTLLYHFVPRGASPLTEYSKGDIEPKIENILDDQHNIDRIKLLRPSIAVPLLALADFETLQRLQDSQVESRWNEILNFATIQRALSILGHRPGWNMIRWRARVADYSLLGLSFIGGYWSGTIVEMSPSPLHGYALLSGALLGGWTIRMWAGLLDRRAARRAKAFAQANVKLLGAIATNQEQPDTETVVAMNAITQELASVVKEKPKAFPRLKFDSCEAMLSAVRPNTTEQ